MELRKLFKFRNVWIGIAMLWIVFFHSGFWIESEAVRFFKNVGYGGVDICLFASGFGCYYSLEKDSDSLRFLKRRLKRLGPTYLCFIIPWLIWKKMVSQLPFQAIIGNLLGIQTLATWEYHFNWYISGLVVFYLAMPYLKQIADSHTAVWKDVGMGIFLAVVSINFWKAGDHVLIFSRMPILYAGVVFGKLAKQGYVLKKKDCLLLGLLTVSGVAFLLAAYKMFPDFLWTKALHWYPFALIIPGVCLFLAFLADRMDSYGVGRWINKSLETIAVYSFELYLVHVFLYEGLMPEITNRFSFIPYNVLWLMTFPVIVGGIYLLNRMACFTVRIFEKESKKV